MTLTNKKLILADDDIVTQQIIKKILYVLNCNEYDICSNIETAINKFEANKYDFLILDMKFINPQNGTIVPKEGMDLIKYLYDKKESVPILVFSSNIEEYRLDLFRYSNASLTIKLLEKPSEIPEITEAIKDCLKLHSGKYMETVLVPEMQDQIKVLQEQIKLLNEPTLKKAIPALTLEFLNKNKEVMFAGIAATAAGLFAYYRNLVGF